MQWLTNGATFVNNFKFWIIGAIALVLSHGAAFELGKSHGRLVEVRHEVAGATQYVDRVVVHERQVAVRNVARERELESNLNRTERLNRELHDQIVAHPSIVPVSNLSEFHVCLLNAAASDPRVASSPTDSSGCDPSESTTPSPVTIDSFVSTEIDIRRQYWDLGVRHDQLVDFVTVEIIQPTRP